MMPLVGSASKNCPSPEPKPPPLLGQCAGPAGTGEGRRGQLAELRPVARREATELADPPAGGEFGDGAGVATSRFEVRPDPLQPQAQHMVPGRLADDLDEGPVQRAAGGAGGGNERVNGDRLGQVGGEPFSRAGDDAGMGMAAPPGGMIDHRGDGAIGPPPVERA